MGTSAGRPVAGRTSAGRAPAVAAGADRTSAGGASALDAAACARWRSALQVTGWTVEAVAALLGGTAWSALMRNQTVPALRATGDRSPVSTQTRLWTVQVPVPVEDVERVLPDLVGQLCVAGVLERSGGEVAALVDVRPYADDDHDWWVVADLTPGLGSRSGRVPPDHVVGVSAASTSLAQLVVRDRVDNALDLGTGSGVQALHLSAHAARVVGTDVNPRALWLAGLTARLNEVDCDLRTGSLFDPVATERFDLVVTNPPFVISAGTGERLTYRDSGLPGDQVVERIVRAAPRHLTAGGWCQMLANWAHLADQPWEERIADWLADSGCDAWVLEREVVDLAAYVETWLGDAGVVDAPDHARRYDSWLSWLEAQGIEAVGMGWLCLRRTERANPVLRCEAWPGGVAQPLGPTVAGWSRRVDAMARLEDRDLLGSRLTRPEHVTQHQEGAPGAADPARITLRIGRGVLRVRQVDTVQAALVGACDGELSVGQILAALAELTGTDAAAMARMLPAVRTLVEEGYLEVT